MEFDLQNLKQHAVVGTHFKLNSQGLYSFDNINKWENEAVEHFTQLQELSVFSNDVIKEAPKVQKNIESDTDEIQTKERPVTPIDDSIENVPESFDVFAKHIRRRILPRKFWTHLKKQNQINMAAVILNEASSKWNAFCELADDPFMSRKLNVELKRRICVRMVEICEQLFLFHANRIILLDKRGVYSHATNLTRTYSKLMEDIHKFMNLYSIRRNVLSDLKEDLIDLYKPGTVCRNKSIPRKIEPVVAVIPKLLSLEALRHSRRSSTKNKQKTERDIREIQKHMKPLNFKSHPLYKLIPKGRLVSTDAHKTKKTSSSTISSMSCVDESLSSQIVSQDLKLVHHLALNKCPSMENLFSLKLLDELNLKKIKDVDYYFNEETRRKRKRTVETKEVLHTCKSIDSSLHMVDWDSQLFKSQESSGYIGPAKNKTVDDLEYVMGRVGHTSLDSKHSKGEKSSEELPPLIEAITRLEKQNHKVKLMKEEGEKLDKRLIERTNYMRQSVVLPTCPQPPCIQVKMSTKNVDIAEKELIIRISDVAIPNNIELPKPKLVIQSPLYNIISGEISNEESKNLDKNLAINMELSEVLKEILDTTDDDYLLFDTDSIVVEAAVNVDLNEVLASHTLSMSPSKQIINEKLAIAVEQPVRMSMTKMPPHLHNKMVRDKNGMKDEGSWLNWWKKNISSDDYLKYLSTQETDYLNVIYHFYNNDDDNEPVQEEVQVQEKSQHEIENRKMLALRQKIIQKKTQQYKDMWNVNTVTLGGLGMVPDNLDELSEFSESDESVLISSEKYDEKTEVNSSKKVNNKTKKQSFNIQGRMDKVWKILQTPYKEIIQLTAIMTANPYNTNLEKEVENWELMSNLVYERESVLAELESFERYASDPSRLFRKGHIKTANRIEEERRRKEITKILGFKTKRCLRQISVMKNKFGYPCITYCGRNYLDKIKTDRTEMLYWLQQERRCEKLKLSKNEILENNEQANKILPPESNQTKKVTKLKKANLH